jgi:signal transduction histidine kinase
MTNSLARLETMRRSFVGSVSHELRTPMTTISGFIDGILDGTIPEDRRDYYLSIVSSEVKRLSRLVSGMLDIAKLEAGEVELKYERFSFNEMLCGIVLGQEQRIEKAGLQIKGLDCLSDTEIVGDKDLIHQVLYNLVDNAIKFTNENGEISFSVTIDNDNLAFIIKNTGDGIPESELPFVFERFYKGDKSRSNIKKSLGLGLYLVKTIVSAHKGQVSVTSKQGEFTAFKVILPKGEH